MDEGFSVFHDVFERHDVGRAGDELERALTARSKAGARHVLSVPVVRALATAPALLRIAGGFVGGTPVPFRATLFAKSPTANWLVAWHQDTALPLRERIVDPTWGPWSVKNGMTYAHAPAWALERIVALRVHLDDSTASNGSLRVLPGTHRRGVLSDGDIQTLTRQVPAVKCLADAGGVVAMRPLIVHASSKATGSARRRVVHIEYVDDVRLAPGVELATTV